MQVRFLYDERLGSYREGAVEGLRGLWKPALEVMIRAGFDVAGLLRAFVDLFNPGLGFTVVDA